MLVGVKKEKKKCQFCLSEFSKRRKRKSWHVKPQYSLLKKVRLASTKRKLLVRNSCKTSLVLLYGGALSDATSYKWSSSDDASASLNETAAPMMDEQCRFKNECDSAIVLYSFSSPCFTSN